MQARRRGACTHGGIRAQRHPHVCMVLAASVVQSSRSHAGLSLCTPRVCVRDAVGHAGSLRMGAAATALPAAGSAGRCGPAACTRAMRPGQRRWALGGGGACGAPWTARRRGPDAACRSCKGTGSCRRTSHQGYPRPLRSEWQGGEGEDDGHACHGPAACAGDNPSGSKRQRMLASKAVVQPRRAACSCSLRALAADIRTCGRFHLKHLGLLP